MRVLMCVCVHAQAWCHILTCESSSGVLPTLPLGRESQSRCAPQPAATHPHARRSLCSRAARMWRCCKARTRPRGWRRSWLPARRSTTRCVLSYSLCSLRGAWARSSWCHGVMVPWCHHGVMVLVMVHGQGQLSYRRRQPVQRKLWRLARSASLPIRTHPRPPRAYRPTTRRSRRASPRPRKLCEGCGAAAPHVQPHGMHPPSLPPTTCAQAYYQAQSQGKHAATQAVRGMRCCRPARPTLWHAPTLAPAHHVRAGLLPGAVAGQARGQAARAAGRCDSTPHRERGQARGAAGGDCCRGKADARGRGAHGGRGGHPGAAGVAWRLLLGGGVGWCGQMRPWGRAFVRVRV